MLALVVVAVVAVVLAVAVCRGAGAHRRKRFRRHKCERAQAKRSLQRSSREVQRGTWGSHTVGVGSMV